MVLDDRYELLHRIGSGGMGSVYAARRLSLGDLVAVKQLSSAADNPHNRSRLLVEARAAAHIRHPSVVKVFDFGSLDSGAPYLVMEHLEGTDLERLLSDVGRLPIPRALELFAPICAAVEAGHRRGVIHRDIKPGNVLVSRSDDGREVVKVLDFGLAIFDQDEIPLDEEPEMVGTPQFMAPEMLRGEPTTPATDVFALGALLFQMVTGELPFPGKSPLQVLIAVIEGQARSAAKFVPDLPAGLVEVLAQALDSDPAARPRSPEQLARRAELASPAAVRSVPQRVKRTEEPADPSSLNFFIARKQEFEQLGQEFRRAVGGDGRLVTLLGDPGIGKTRLVEHFVQRIFERERAVVLWGRFFDQRGSQAPAYKTFRAMLAKGSDSPSGVLHGDERDQVKGTKIFDFESEGDTWRVHTGIADAFAARAGGLPLILVLDDLQWAGRADLDLLDHLHQSLGKRGTLIVATLRPGRSNPEVQRWQRNLAARRLGFDLELKPFDQDEVDQFLRTSFGSLHIHPRDLRRLFKISGGNPFFLAEIVRHLMVGKKIARFDEGWRCEPLEGLELPPTLARLVEVRLEDLDPALRKMLQVAAVIGDPLRVEVLAAVAQLDELVLEDLLDQGISEGLLRDDTVPVGSDCAFAADTIRRALYDSTSRSRRRRIHRRALEVLRRAHAGDLRSVAPVLAQHAAAIEDWAETFRWGLEAAERALEVHDGDTAESCLKAAQTAVDRLDQPLPDETRRRFEWAAGVLARRLGRLQEAKIHLLRALEGQPDGQRRDEVRLDLARCLLAAGELDEGLALVREMADRDPKDSPVALTVQIGMCESTLLLRLGRMAEAAQRLDELLALADDQVAISMRARVLRERAWAALKLGDFAEAETLALRGLDLARAAGDLRAEHHAFSALAAIHAETGDIEKAMPFHHKALELARRLSLRRREGIDMANLGEAHFRLEDHEQALDHFRAALGIFVEIGDRACEGDCRVNVGRALLAQGDSEAALETLEAGRKICESTGRKEYAGIARLYEGEAHLDRRRLETAGCSLEAARALFSTQGSYLLWRAELGLAKVAAAEGKKDAAVDFAHRAQARLKRLSLESSVTGSRYFEQALSTVEELLKSLG